MRIKSYFDRSIQTAMRQARHEFGDDVMLVTSRIAPPEFRCLGDFEVVFAVDESETGPKAEDPPQPEPPKTAFGEMFRLACAVPSAEEAREAAIASIRSRLLDVGLAPATAEGLIALIRLHSPRTTTQPSLTGAAYDPVRLLTAGEFESGPDNPEPVDLMSLLPEPTTEVPEPAPIKLAPQNEGTVIRPPPGRIPTSDRQADSQAASYAVRLPLRKSGVPLQCGFGLMLAAFSLYGIMRRSGS